MKRYFDREDFIEFLNLLEEGKYTKLFTESIENNNTEYNFLKTKFKDTVIILYDHPYGGIGIISDNPPYDWEDIAEGVFDDLECDGEYKVYIEENKT